MDDGNGKACQHCGEACNSFAGNPGLWPVGLHSEVPGVLGWWHRKCAVNLIEIGRAALRLHALVKDANT